MTLENVLEEIGHELEARSELISDGKQNDKITEFIVNAQNIRSTLERVEEDGRLMRLGIVGAVKAGKTSFLNALLFDGKTVLPKAATPMTAALTRIRYSAKPSATVYFYDSDDWDQNVARYALSYDHRLESEYQNYLRKHEERQKEMSKTRKIIKAGVEAAINFLSDGKQNRDFPQDEKPKLSPPMSFQAFEKANKSLMSNEEIACHEIYNMARERMEAYELRECLGTVKSITSDVGEELLNELSDYVGATGKYTPIVKYTVIELDIPALEGVEIIDTPGMNDPVISRGRTTRDFMKECDALFLLSYCGQFLDREDMQLISRVLPEDGVARCILVGTKMDSAVLQYNRRNATFDEAFKRTRFNLNEQAKDNLQKLANPQIQSILADPEDPNKLQKPYFTSSLAYSASRKLAVGMSLDSEEQKMVDNLENRFTGFSKDPEYLAGFSQIGRIRDEIYPAVRSHKEQITEESKKNTREGQRGKFLRILEDIANETRQIHKDLRDCDIDELREKLQVARDGLDRARVAVSGIFDSASVKVEKTIIPELQIDVRTEVENHLNINVTTSTRVEHSGSLFVIVITYLYFFLWRHERPQKRTRSPLLPSSFRRTAPA